MTRTLQIMKDCLYPAVLDENAAGRPPYSDIYDCERRGSTKHAWLIPENSSLCKFLDALGRRDQDADNEIPLDMHNFFAARNITFPALNVSIISETRSVTWVKDLAGILQVLALRGEKYLQHAVVLEAAKTSPTILKLRREILQQFIYLKMYMPVIIAPNFPTAFEKFSAMRHGKRQRAEVYVFGAKKSGKSTVINAMLGAEYLPSSPELPTPCNVICSEGTAGGKILLNEEGGITAFTDPDTLRKHLETEFLRHNVPETVRLELPAFPVKLRGLTFVDTPGPNLAGAREHSAITAKALERAERGIFVMNYSAHLTDNEAEFFSQVAAKFKGKTLLVALNRIDEMYSAGVVKSPERAADYVASRLAALGHDGFLIVPVSAVTALYAKRLAGVLGMRRGNLERRLAGAGKLTRQEKDAVAFVEGVLGRMRNFHGRDVRSFHELCGIGGIEYFVHVVGGLCRQKERPYA